MITKRGDFRVGKMERHQLHREAHHSNQKETVGPVAWDMDRTLDVQPSSTTKFLDAQTNKFLEPVGKAACEAHMAKVGKDNYEAQTRNLLRNSLRTATARRIQSL